MKILLPLILLMAPVPAQDPDVLVIRAERIITVSGDDIVNGVIVIENGKIKAIGKNISVPDGAKFLKAKVVMPGLVDAGIQPGISGRSNEDAKEVTPTFRVVSAINPKSADLRRIIQNGVTTIYVGPGNRNVIGGLGSVIRTVKTTTSSLVLRT